MFTGLVEAVGEFLEVGARTRVATELKLGVGDSVALDGCCLTVVEHGPGWFAADAVAETLRRTTLGLRRPGDRVNLERPLAVDGRIGGHFVQGHVDAIGHVVERQVEQESLVLSFAAPERVLRYVVEKGSIAVDGVSLTVAACTPTVFRVAVIPLTQRATTLGARQPGDAVNLEADILAKYVERAQLARSEAQIAARGDDAPRASLLPPERTGGGDGPEVER